MRFGTFPPRVWLNPVAVWELLARLAGIYSPTGMSGAGLLTPEDSQAEDAVAPQDPWAGGSASMKRPWPRGETQRGRSYETHKN